LPAPVTFIGSGSRAPHLRKRKPPIYDLPKPQFIAALRELNGTPDEVFESRELLDLLDPLLRADFKIAETYCAAPVPLDCRVVVLTGVDDYEVSWEEAERWRDLSARGCDVHRFPGGHFFIEENRSLVLERINKVIADLLRT
jgi:surfactin synthase thioesterase subunit